MDADEAVFSKLGLDFSVLDSGCCGLAGSFGYEKGERYDVSMKAGERILLPTVRSAPKDTLIVADGFSCRQQIAHATDRRALHLGQVIQMALREGEHGPPGDYPEARYTPAGKAGEG
jgi:Fe-S oxidoreductase